VKPERCPPPPPEPRPSLRASTPRDGLLGPRAAWCLQAPSRELAAEGARHQAAALAMCHAAWVTLLWPSLSRYLSWSSPLAKKVEEGKATLEELEAYALKTPEPRTASGKQEYLEQLINRYI